jgi:hypothetical protein
LREGAPFVAEMGGAHNVAVIDAALEAAAGALHLDVPAIRKFFPTVAQEATLLEAAGFGITQMWWFPRPTPLAAGHTPADWSRVFRADLWAAIPADMQPEFEREVLARCGALRHGEAWRIDYHRLRFVCHAV